MSTVNKVLNVARGWLGYSEQNGKFKEILNVYNSHKPLARGYAIKENDEWCDAFVSACAIKAGAVSIIGTEVGVQKHVDIFKSKGIWIEDGSTKPRVGDIIVFNWDDNTQANDGYADHIGFVEQVTGNTIICIEGNKERSVSRRTINVGWGYIRGYARPKYKAEEVKIPVVKKDINSIAQEVIQGAWGTGKERVDNLTAAGYDSGAVQKRVNAILAGKSGVKKSIDVIVKEVKAGLWGNGKQRSVALTAAGYNPVEVQTAVNNSVKWSPTPTPIHRVEVTATLLNVRKLPSANSKITGLIKKKEVYTITETKNGWGKLKSGLGWINLKYTRRI